MERQAPSVETLIRHAFALLLEIRRDREARRLLSLAIAFLKTLLRDADTHAQPVVLSVQALRIRRI